ncbi:MAG: YihY family inner membrane protein [Spirochaetes bacterium]|jgi:membrane protein|nr:YihY family inner membrane protein [Spirochaetota bacterium]
MKKSVSAKKSARIKGKEKKKKKLTRYQKIKTLIVTFFKNATDEEYLTDITYGRVSRSIISTIKVFIASGRKFMEDDCLTKATAITYTTLISLIPTLTVVLTFISIFKGVGAQKEEIFDQITRFLAEYNLQRLNITPILDAISGLLDNAKSIGGVGAIVLIFTATAVLRTTEKSLNSIWKIKKSRPIFVKFIYYWSALTLGPLMLFAGATLATQLSASFTEPDYNVIYKYDNKFWVAGSKATIGYRSTPLGELTPIPISSIDFENQRIYSYHEEVGDFVADNTNLMNEIQFENSTFNDIVITSSQLIVIGNNGIILRSDNKGISWKLDKFSFFNLRKIHMFDDLSGIILSDQGTLLRTDDGCLSWNLIEIPEVNVNLHDIEFVGSYGIIVGNDGYILESFDNGNSWIAKQLNKARSQNNYLSLNSVDMFGNFIIIAGDEGLILKSENRGKTFTTRKFRDDHYSAVIIENKTNYYVGTQKGKLIYTDDDGVTWQTLLKSSKKINSMITTSNRIILAGKTGMILYTDDHGFNWNGDQGKSILLYILNFVAPFAVIWLLFLLMYLVMPNTRIPFRAAALGASFTGSVWVAFIYLFIIYVKSFANGTFAIYGALAAFPLLLLLIYASNNIVLFGAEVAYTLMYPTTYKNLKRKIAIRDYIQVINGVRILYLIYNKFESGKGGTDHQEILKLCGNNITETDFYIDLFKEKQLLLMTDNVYTPATASSNIIISDIVAIIHNFTFETTAAQSDPVKKNLGSKFKKISESFRSILGKQTLKDIINEK